MFVDQVRISAKAGDGGKGCVSFRREKFVPKGGPDGGDGGRGGDIILKADPNIDTLAAFYYEPIVRAKNGGAGMAKNCTGRAAKANIIKVPIGTLIYRMPEVPAPAVELEIDEALMEEVEEIDEKPKAKKKINPKELELVADLDQDGAELVLCKGGEGGKGNVHFKSARNRVPRQYKEGGDGEEGQFFLELRKIADAGLVGYPNAGKSTLLGQISAAHPKVAPYPFTTLHPMVGVVDFSGYRRGTVADIPGLIEGAHLDIGLGHEFLRHIVRCKLLLFVLDMAGSEGRSPIEDLSKLRVELKMYDPLLAERPWLVVANKMDLPDAAENLKAFKRRFRKVEVIPISAKSDQGITELKARLKTVLLPVSTVEPSDS
ncbi:MAG: GTPase ObgE [Chthoniobacteraceae bacterium]